MTATATTPRVAANRTRARGGARARGRVGQKPRTFYLFISPWLIGFILLTLFPLGYALWLSFTNWDGISPGWSYVGLRNYTQIFHDEQTLQSLGRTGLFTLITVPTGVISGLALAVMVNRPLLGRGLWRTLYYLPAVVPAVAGAMTFKLLFDRDNGAVNGAIEAVGGHGVTWLADPYVRSVLIFMVLWGVGGSMIISLAGLQDVPKELHEAARVDGANPWQIFARITVPLISPILLFQVVTGVIGALQVFVPPLLLAPVNGAAGVTTVPEGNRLFMVHVYAEYFAMGHFGYASALLWVLFLIVLVITGLVFKIGSRAVFYGTEPNEGKGES